MSELLTPANSQAEFLKGGIISDFLPRTPAEGIVGGPILRWSTPVCGWVTRHLCTSVFCGPPPITRDPTLCPRDPAP
jgi:hypothetical protein